jgi:hypothetical protein
MAPAVVGLTRVAHAGATAALRLCRACASACRDTRMVFHPLGGSHHSTQPLALMRIAAGMVVPPQR